MRNDGFGVLVGFAFGFCVGVLLASIIVSSGGKLTSRKPWVPTAVPDITPALIRFKLPNGEEWECYTDERWDCVKVKEATDGQTLE